MTAPIMSSVHFLSTSPSARASSFADSMDRDQEPPETIAIPKPTLSISRSVQIPDLLRVDRCYRLPEYGPKILFFSGGSAPRSLSAVLKHYTHNSIHLITPFDSGGSSAEIRKAFNMLSVGDLRNRLLALKDDSPLGTRPEVSTLFSYRLSAEEPLLANAEFYEILQGQHPLIRQVKLPMRSILTSHLRWFAQRRPQGFELCGASIGNLIITGCFLEHDRDIVTAIFLIARLLGVNGTVRPLTGANLHIRAHYSDGSVQVGQHLLGKSKEPRKIQEVDLVESLTAEDSAPSTDCHIDIVSSELVAKADVICFPVGSFFGSVLINLVPDGVGRAIVQRHCPKVYIPNTGSDPEMYGYTLKDCVERIVDMVRRDAGANIPISQILTTVLVDTVHCEYCVSIDKTAIEDLGIVVLDVPLVEKTVEKEKATQLDPTKVTEVLLTLGS